MFKRSDKTMYRGKWFYRQFFTYLCMLLIPIVVSLQALGYANQHLDTNIQNHSQMILERYANAIQAQLQQASLFSFEMGTALTIQECTLADSFDPFLRLDIYRLLQKIPAKLAQYPLISDFYIFFPRSGQILSATGTYSAEQFYQWDLQDLISYESWLSMLQNHGQFGTFYTTNPGLVSSADYRKSILYVNKLAVSHNDEQPVMVLLISREALSSTCLSSSLDVDGEISIYNSEGAPVIASQGSIQNIRFDPEKRSFYSLSSNSITTVYEMPSLSAALVYHVTGDSFMVQLWNVYHQFRSTLVIIILVGVVLAIVFTYIAYRPLGELVGWLSQKQDIPVSKDESGYSYIRHSLTRIMSRQQQADQELIISRRIMGDEYLLRLLEGRSGQDEKYRERLSSYGLELPCPQAMVVLCKSGLVRIQDHLFWNSFRTAIERALELPTYSHRIQVNESLSAVVLNFAGSITNGQKETLMVELKALAENQELKNCTFGLGTQVEAEELSLSYRQAQTALETAFLRPDQVVFDAASIQNLSTKYHYPQETENQLMKAVLKGEEETVAKLLEQLFQTNIEGRMLTVEAANTFLSALMNTAYKIEYQLQTDGEPVYQIPPIAMLTSCLNIREAHDQLDFIFRSLCTFSHMNAQEDGGVREYSWRMEKIMEYLDAHYLDNTFSLEQAADHFHITPQYLSSLFKKSYGENFSVCVQKMRLTEAKRLMANPAFTLSAIAQRSGFTNYLALARAFQKYDGSTPGAYRQKHFENGKPEQDVSASQKKGAKK